MPRPLRSYARRPTGAIVKRGQLITYPKKKAADPPTLQFAGDTWVSFPSGPWDSGVDSRVTFQVRHDAGGYRTHYASEASTRAYGSYKSSNTPNGRHTMARNNVQDTCTQEGPQYVVGVWYDVVEDCYPGGGIVTTIDEFGAELSEALVNPAGGAFPGPWRIGYGDPELAYNPLVGALRNLRYFDENDVLQHHWPLNDVVSDGGTIVDIVGGLNGILTLGSGSWE